MLLARKAVAMPIELAIKLRRSMPSFLAFSSAMTPIRYSTCICLGFCGRGMNSSLETTWVGTGESTPFLRSRCHLGIHMKTDSLRRKAPGEWKAVLLKGPRAAAFFLSHRCTEGTGYRSVCTIGNLSIVVNARSSIQEQARISGVRDH